MFKLPPLPYRDNALDPVISANTISYYYGAHHKKYVEDLNKLIEGTEYEGASLEKVIAESAGQVEKLELCNNAAQTWNHTFYWLSMKRGGSGKPTGKLAGMIDTAFQKGIREDHRFTVRHRLGLARAGWWRAEGRQVRRRRVAVYRTPKPLLTIDVREHAYYLDYQNKRPAYVDAVIDKLLNWEFAETTLA
jgi:Fe-Mn family superoxide dismutase